MTFSEKKSDILLSLPHRAAKFFSEIAPFRSNNIFVSSDPDGKQCGSGGGTVHLLLSAWQENRKNNKENFEDWLISSRKIVIHGCGESRRLPAYAAVGKPLIPIPFIPGIIGQRLDQKLLDLQINSYEHFLFHAPEAYRLMTTCGDVLIIAEEIIPPYPIADILIVGMPSSPEEASHHGVLINTHGNSYVLETFLQKPSPHFLEKIAKQKEFYIDTGIWFFSSKAISFLLKKCGIDISRISHGKNRLKYCDLFGEVGPSLGIKPDKKGNTDLLTSAILPIRKGKFYHFGTNEALLDSTCKISAKREDLSISPHNVNQKSICPPIIINSEVKAQFSKESSFIWIDNSFIPSSWQLSSKHVLTGIPPNTWKLNLKEEQCLDIIKLEGSYFCLRPYNFYDCNKGKINDLSTQWMGMPFTKWLSARNLSFKNIQISPDTDIFDAPLYPVLKQKDISEELILWMIAEKPPCLPGLREKWLCAKKISARNILQVAELVSASRNLYKSITNNLCKSSCKEGIAKILSSDLVVTAQILSSQKCNPKHLTLNKKHGADDIAISHSCMFASKIYSTSNKNASIKMQNEAFFCLRNAIVKKFTDNPVVPSRNVLEDQIVWARSPVRLDIAGGWTDTPPYCLEYGGKVTNLAVNLNGQPPIQVFGRFIKRNTIILRSIDLGLTHEITTYKELSNYASLNNAFSLAKAALALTGLEPRFRQQPIYPSLKKQLEAEFHGGIEISMVCAIPKGSGLGTSSVLGATILGLLSNIFGLNWSLDDIFARTMALEQMLTSGGGWQDQIGGISPGVKLISTLPGIHQQPTLRWLPEKMFKEAFESKLMQLYYTGLTRTAYDILGEIVKSIFLNSSRHLSILKAIGQNAEFAADAIQRGDWQLIRESIRRSWELNQLLDSGTNPPQMRPILRAINKFNPVYKLLGAGGGGYLLILAPDIESGIKIREALSSNPPNPRARFVEAEISRTGMEITRS